MSDAVTRLNPALVVFALLGLVLLIQAMLLKLGLMKPGWQGAQTVLGNTLLGLGFLWYGASEMVLGLSGTANGVALTIFALLLTGGWIVTVRARNRYRKTTALSNESVPPEDA